MEINGSYITGGSVPHPQRVFVSQTSIDRVHAVAAMYSLPEANISKMLRDACDDENYRRDVWRKTIENIKFQFHLARFEVELRSFSNIGT